MDHEDLKQLVTGVFSRRFRAAPDWIVRAPGRVNLIGEHTDYNDGFVLPIAIERAVWIALRPRSDRIVRVYSVDYDEESDFDLGALERNPSGWLEYLKGSAWALLGNGYELHGWEGIVAGDVPPGAGLSSSAALELATLRAFAAVGELGWPVVEMARSGQEAENAWVGVNCGIMDQIISAAGKEGSALLIDCRSLEFTSVPLPKGTVVVVLDTATRRGLVDSAYNERRRQCELGAAFFGVDALRDVDFKTFEELAGGLDAVVRKRVRHVVTENERTLKTAEAMRRGDATLMGRLMSASHASLRDDFQVSSEALDLIVDLAWSEAGCFGARMTGAGFGGCAVALVESERAQSFAERVGENYVRKSGIQPSIYITEAAAGASAELFAGETA